MTYICALKETVSLYVCIVEKNPNKAFNLHGNRALSKD